MPYSALWIGLFYFKNIRISMQLLSKIEYYDIQYVAERTISLILSTNSFKIIPRSQFKRVGFYIICVENAMRNIQNIQRYGFFCEYSTIGKMYSHSINDIDVWNIFTNNKKNTSVWEVKMYRAADKSLKIAQYSTLKKGHESDQNVSIFKIHGAIRSTAYQICPICPLFTFKKFTVRQLVNDRNCWTA